MRTNLPGSSQQLMKLSEAQSLANLSGSDQRMELSEARRIHLSGTKPLMELSEARRIHLSGSKPLKELSEARQIHLSGSDQLTELSEARQKHPSGAGWKPVQPTTATGIRRTEARPWTPPPGSESSPSRAWPSFARWLSAADLRKDPHLPQIPPESGRGRCQQNRLPEAPALRLGSAAGTAAGGRDPEAAEGAKRWGR